MPFEHGEDAGEDRLVHLHDHMRRLMRVLVEVNGGIFVPLIDGLVDRLHQARRDELPLNMAPVRQEWRDRRLMALLAHKNGQPDLT